MTQIRTENALAVTQVAQSARQSPRTAQLLLARLAIESALRFEGVSTAVSGHQILLQGAKTYALIDVQPAAGPHLAVQIRSFLGEVLLSDEARLYVEEQNAKTDSIEITLSDEGVVTLFWRQEFSAEFNPSIVLAALHEICALMDAMQTTLQEEYYLQAVDATRIRRLAGGGQ